MNAMNGSDGTTSDTAARRTLLNDDAHLYWGLGPLSQSSRRAVFSRLPVSTMDAKPQRPKDREDAVSALNKAIEALNLGENTSSIPPVKAVFGSVSTLLATIRVFFFYSSVMICSWFTLS